MYLIVEDKIKEAVDNGDLNDLPGKGEKLDLRDDLPGMSPELNQAYKILKNAGFVPEQNKDRKKYIKASDLVTYAIGDDYQHDFSKGNQFDRFVKKRKWHRNPAFPSYRKKMLKKFFEESRVS